MADETITLKLVAQDLASGNISKAIGKIDTLAKRGGILGSVMQGVGMSFGMMLNPVYLATAGIGKVTDIMGDAVAAAMKEEESIAQLSRAIEENDVAWDGNVEALERVLNSREELAFADDEQRESLRQLVAVTKDTTKALDLQRTAMDLARLRGMDLATASLLIGKVFAGNLGILSRYGIVLEKGTTATEALREIQRRAAGQAEAYAETTGGKLVRAQIELDNAMEALGRTITPVVGQLAGLAAEVIPDLVDEVGRFLETMSSFDATTRNLIEWRNLWDDTTEGIDTMGEAMKRLKSESEKGIFGALAKGDIAGAEALIDVYAIKLPAAIESAADADEKNRQRARQSLAMQGKLTNDLVVDMEAYGEAVEDVASTSFPELRDAARETQAALKTAFKTDSLAALRREEKQLAIARRRAVRDVDADALAIIDARQAEIDATQEALGTVKRAAKQEHAIQQEKRKAHQQQERAIERVARQFSVSEGKVRRELRRTGGDIDKVKEKLGEEKSQLDRLGRTKSKPEVNVQVTGMDKILTLEQKIAALAGRHIVNTVINTTRNWFGGNGDPIKHSGGSLMPNTTYLMKANERVTLGPNQRGHASVGAEAITINIGYVRDAKSFAREVGPELERWRRSQAA